MSNSTVAGPTFLDFMALATSLTKASKLKADSEDWSRAWRRALGSSAAQALLPEVTFEGREPYAPLSEQVEALIRSLSRAGILSLHNPRYRYYTIEEKDKDLIRVANAEALSSHKSILQQIADVLDEELGTA